MEESQTNQTNKGTQNDSFDYSFVNTIGHVAVYDDLHSAPRVIEIPPAETASYIETLTMTIYREVQAGGGRIPHQVIREVSENFIHAHFEEIVVSIIDRGNTVRFADQGPGISSKEKAQQFGFSSANSSMRNYIRGVGSGLPVVREYLEVSKGTLTIEDNIDKGTVVTVSLVRQEDDPLDDWQEHDVSSVVTQKDIASAPPQTTSLPPQTQPLPYYQSTPWPAQSGGIPAPYYQAAPPGFNPYSTVQPGYPVYPTPTPTYSMPAGPGTVPMPSLDPREITFLKYFLSEGPLGVTDMAELTHIPKSTVSNTMNKLQQAGLVSMIGKARTLTPYGQSVAQML